MVWAKCGDGGNFQEENRRPIFSGVFRQAGPRYANPYLWTQVLRFNNDDRESSLFSYLFHISLVVPPVSGSLFPSQVIGKHSKFSGFHIGFFCRNNVKEVDD